MKEFFKNFWNNERLFKSYVTSLLAVCLVGYMLYLQAEDRLTTEDAVAYGGWAITLFRAKDTILGRKPRPVKEDQCKRR